MSFKSVVDAKRAKREEAIREAAALVSKELSDEDRRIVSSNGASSDYVTPLSPFILILLQHVRLFSQSGKVDGRQPRS